jgi:SNF2 family DNA or RNA helicase
MKGDTKCKKMYCWQAHLPGLSYLRLDGSVPASDRHGLVSRFNADPSIDLLLLTTNVGGLGLNLTGADTVIFVEHDWNPMKDLQVLDYCTGTCAHILDMDPKEGTPRNKQ